MLLPRVWGEDAVRRAEQGVRGAAGQTGGLLVGLCGEL